MVAQCLVTSDEMATSSSQGETECRNCKGNVEMRYTTLQ